MDGDISISMPADAGLIHILRTVTGGVAARLDFSIDDIDDLRLAVDEAAAHLLSIQPRPERLVVVFRPAGDRLDVSASASGSENGDQPWPAPQLEGTLTWQILTALADGTAMAREGDANDPTIRFSKRLVRQGPGSGGRDRRMGGAQP